MYYRAIIEFKGNTTTFNPTGYYEAFDDEGIPIFHSGDVIAKSDIPEIACSKSIGGALLGVWSMLNHYGNIQKDAKIFIYGINETPSKDISHITFGDFELLQEVRYKDSVVGQYIGYYIFDNNFNNNASLYYEIMGSEPWDEFSDEDINILREFEDFIRNVDENVLK